LDLPEQSIILIKTLKHESTSSMLFSLLNQFSNHAQKGKQQVNIPSAVHVETGATGFVSCFLCRDVFLFASKNLVK
jgi:hypothetical protein